jgi:hypothetical protein
LFVVIISHYAVLALAALEFYKACWRVIASVEIDFGAFLQPTLYITVQNALALAKE